MKSNTLYIASLEPEAGKLIVTMGLMEMLTRSIGNVAFYRPVIDSETERDGDIELIRKRYCPSMNYEDSFGFQASEVKSFVAEDRMKFCLEELIKQLNALKEQYDFVLCEGLNSNSFLSAFDVGINMEIANWAFNNTRNGYIPFGTDGAIRARSKDAHEFVYNLEAYSDQLVVEKENKKQRMLNDKINSLEKIIIQQRNAIDDLKYRLDLSMKSNTEIAKDIINSHTKPVYYYMYEIERIINDKAVDVSLLENILKKFNVNSTLRT